MKKTCIAALVLLASALSAQNLAVPAGYKQIAEKEGDLDRDGIAEKVIVYNTADSTDFGLVRDIRILKRTNGKWTLWQSSKKAILKSEEGGMMGEPFQDIDIKNNILLIYHAGGSSWKWSYTDKYRFQENAFALIGHTSTYGKPCEYWADFDFNLSTGQIAYKKEYERCSDNDNEPEIYRTEQETFYKKGLKLNLSNRHAAEIKLVSPKHKFELYL